MKNFRKVVTGLSILALTATSFASNMPFPQNKSYGTKPSLTPESMQRDIQDKYDLYLSTFFTSNAPGNGAFIRAKDTDGTRHIETVSEAHGYGMILTAIMDDQARFDSLLTFYYEYQRQNKLMDWRIDDQGDADDGSAADGDLDIAYALLLADKQWGGNTYKSLAEEIINSIWDDEVYNASNLLPSPGDSWGEGDTYGPDHYTRPSDWMTGHFRSFEGIGYGDWDKAADSAYAFYNAHRNNSTGLVPDFYYGYSGATGNKTIEGDTDDDYYYNACRVPLRFAMDYATSTSNDAKTALTTIGNWINSASGGSADKIYPGYTLSGSPLKTSYTDVVIQAPFGAGLIATNHQSLMTSIWNTLKNDTYFDVDDNDATNAYGAALSLLSMLVMSGNWWAPDASNSGGSGGISSDYIIIDDFENAYGDDNSQSYLGAANGWAWGEDLAQGGDSTFYGQPYIGSGWWYAYAEANSSVKASTGESIDGDDDDFNLAVKNKMLDIVMVNNSTSGDGYAAVELPLMADIAKSGDTTIATDKPIDLSKMDAIIVTYSSDQPVWFSFATEDTKDFEWGTWGRKLPATNGMVTDTIVVGLIGAEADSPLADSVAANPTKWSWAISGSKAVSTIAFNAQGEEKKSITTNLKVDKIVFNGVTYSDLGINWVDPDGITPVTSAPVHSTKAGLALTHKVMNGALALNFNLPTATQVKATLFTPAGRAVTEISMSGVSGANTLNLNTRGLAQGLYLLRLNAGETVQTSRINLMR